MVGGLKNVYESLSWEQPFLSKALALLTETSSPDDLQVVAGLALRGAQECQARKVFAFHAILGHVQAPAGEGEASPTEDGEAASGIGPARRAVWDVARAFVDDAKDDALKTTFLEPTKLYHRAVGDHSMEGDVDVHGVNTYLAVLLACLGVQLNRQPFLRDEVKGVADFLAAGMDEGLTSLWDDDNFGKLWESVPQLRSHQPRPSRRISARSFVFGGHSPREVANAAVDPAGSAQEKKHLALYLQRFARFFSAPFLVPRLLSRLLSDEGRPEALQVLFDDLVAQEPQWAGEGDEGDVRFWLWDMEAFPAQLRSQRAERLLRHAGVLR